MTERKPNSRIVSEINSKGSISNSDLEVAEILLQWLVLEHIAPPLY